jgi:hypothetical protein
MIATIIRFFFSVAIVLAVPVYAWAIDTVELTTGVKATGRIRSYSGSTVIIDVKIGTRTFQRRYPKNRMKAIFVDGKQVDMKTGKTSTAPSNGRVENPREEILAEIDRQGKAPPDWFEKTPLNYPKTLDLA